MGVSAIRSMLAMVCCCLILSQLAASVPAAPDYDALNEVYDWLTDHGLERRAPPSMRLRFGKRDMGWQVAQRSMPSLRLRFGKRTIDQDEPLYDHELVRKDRTPALRLRFGKRDIASYGQDEGLAGQEQ